MANINMADTIDNNLELRLALCIMQIAQCMKALISFDCLLHEDFKTQYMMGFWSFMEWWIDGWMDHTPFDGYNDQSSCGAKNIPYGDDFNSFFLT